MGSIDIGKPLSTALSSAVHKSQQHQDKNSWERWVSNPGLMGEKQECYLCAMQPPHSVQIFFGPELTTGWTWSTHSPGFFLPPLPEVELSTVQSALNSTENFGVIPYLHSLSLSLSYTHTRTHKNSHTHTRTHLLTSLPLAFNLAVRNLAFFVQVHFEPIALLAESLNSRVKTPRHPTAP